MEQLDVLYCEVMELIAPFVRRYVYWIGSNVQEYDITPQNVVASGISGFVLAVILVAFLSYGIGRYLGRHHLTVFGLFLKAINTVGNTIMVILCIIGWTLVHRRFPKNSVIKKITTSFFGWDQM